MPRSRCVRVSLIRAELIARAPLTRMVVSTFVSLKQKVLVCPIRLVDIQQPWGECALRAGLRYTEPSRT